MSHDHDDELMTPEVSEILGIDRATVTRWVRTGRLVPTRKLGGRTGPFLFRRGDVDDLARQLQQAASA